MNNTKQASKIFWIIFIAIVAITAIMVFPRYGVLSEQLRESHARSYVATLTSSSAANFTQRRVNAANGVAIKNCKDVVNIGGISLPMDYQITDQTIEPGKVAICTLHVPGIKPVQFSEIGVS